jgi:hypothetical protein
MLPLTQHTIPEPPIWNKQKDDLMSSIPVSSGISLQKDTAPDLGIPHAPDTPPDADDWGDAPGDWGGTVPSWGTDTPGAVLPWGTDTEDAALRWGTDPGPEGMARAFTLAMGAGTLIAILWRLAALGRGLWG